MISKVLIASFVYLVALIPGQREVVGNLLYYKGTIGADTQIQMNFEINENGTAEGSYIVEKSGELFVLEGSVSEKSQKIYFVVYNKERKKVAVIDATYYIDMDQQIQDIEGVWKPFDGNAALRLKLEKIAEVIV